MLLHGEKIFHKIFLIQYNLLPDFQFFYAALSVQKVWLKSVGHCTTGSRWDRFCFVSFSCLSTDSLLMSLQILLFAYLWLVRIHTHSLGLSIFIQLSLSSALQLVSDNLSLQAICALFTSKPTKNSQTSLVEIFQKEISARHIDLIYTFFRLHDLKWLKS